MSGAETRSAYAFEQITVPNSATRLTGSNIRTGTASTKKVVITVESANIRYRVDGTNPTATVGELVTVTQRITLTSFSDIENFRAIRTGSTSATLDVHYYD